MITGKTKLRIVSLRAYNVVLHIVTKYECLTYCGSHSEGGSDKGSRRAEVRCHSAEDSPSRTTPDLKGTKMGFELHWPVFA